MSKKDVYYFYFSVQNINLQEKKTIQNPIPHRRKFYYCTAKVSDEDKKEKL